MKACDVCGKEARDLVALRDIYQTDEIKEVCFDCQRIIEDNLGRIRSMQAKMVQGLLKRFIAMLRRKKRGE